ncbi:hypothetical protein [Butyrivibrio sp. YAB3001]|uniref:hypothetical protein n=1 Tax=Butyrivibrio sp. YAB3001 TaxID=1520812 RepID=UPI0008F68180|nr:hypothetical protein [Butyrivibrio sp. YAB3001]SFD06740.1 hypothetical protein SAMN02910398_03953 [Butyrivibrio sp. YAB3001]
MKRITVKKLIPYVSIMLMCISVSACGQSTTTSTTTEETTISASTDNQPQSEAPEKPDGEAPSGEAPGEPPSGEKPDGAPGDAPGGGFGGGGMSSADIDYTGAVEISSADSQDGQTYESTTADESALLIATSDDVTISNATVNKTGDSDGGDNCNFYGLNATVLVKDGSTTTITGATITSDADGANGVFSYGGNGGQNGADGDGTTVIISDSTITTKGDGSGGIMTTGGGITKASNLTVETSGQSSAAIRTDRGGGTVTVDGGTYTTNGLGSPSIYSTADITVSNATLVSNLSEAVCIEGMNSITLVDCDMTANNTKTNGNATFFDTIMIYQSMSGDADSGTSTFDMTGGSLTSENGHVFHVTNTNAVINLNNVKITNNDSDNILLSVCDDGWSGADNIATVNAVNQTLEGTILVGSNSTLTLNITEGSNFTGSISGMITNSKGDTVSTEVGEVNVTLDKNSTWTLTADTYITSFDGDISNIISTGYTLYVNGTAIN